MSRKVDTMTKCPACGGRVVRQESTLGTGKPGFPCHQCDAEFDVYLEESDITDLTGHLVQEDL